MDNFRRREDDLRTRFQAISPFLERWGGTVAKLLEGMMIDLKGNRQVLLNNILFPRVYEVKLKEEKEIISQAFYRGSELEFPLRQITDKIVVKVVLISERDLNYFKDSIVDQDEWIVKERRKARPNFFKPSQYLYETHHLIAFPSDKYISHLSIPDHQVEMISCDIQLRTILQDTLEEIAKATIDQGPFSGSAKLTDIFGNVVSSVTNADLNISKALELMRIDSEYERSFLNQLIDIGNKHLDLEAQYSRGEVDYVLTKELFARLDVNNIDINKVRQVVVRNKVEFELLIKKLQSYLSNQPVVILIAYLVIAKSFFIREVWHLENEILEEIFYRLGYSFTG